MIAQLWLTLHLIGVGIGVGVATVSDILFLKSIEDMRLDRTETRFLRILGTLVWGGLFILVVSGIGLFLQNPEKYLTSAKFLSKITIVFILLANGVYLHRAIHPMIQRLQGKSLAQESEFFRVRHRAFVSGAISITSWYSALILGSFGTSPADYWQLMGIYALLLAIAISVSLFTCRILFNRYK